MNQSNLIKECSKLFRFTAVGCSAAAVNLLIVWILVECRHWAPLIANILAFFIAFNVSYWGHRIWTFKHKAPVIHSLPKFFTVSCLGLVLNEAIFFVLLYYMHWHYLFSLFLTLLVVAAITFIFSRCWAFH